MIRRNSTLLVVLGLVGGLTLGALEAPAVDYNWIDPTGGNWSDGTNWDLGSPPGPTDNAFIQVDDTYTIILNVSTTVNDLTFGGPSGAETQTFVVSGQTLTIDGVATFNGNTIFDLINGSTVNGAGSLVNQGTFRPSGSTISVPFTNEDFTRIRGTVTANGGLTTAATSLIVIEGFLGTNAIFNVGSSFTNTGEIQLTNLALDQSATLNVVTGTFTNDVAGTVSTLAGSGGGSRTLSLALDNQGTLTIGHTTTLTKFSAQHVNSGDLNITGGALNVSQLGTNPTFTNSGNMDIGGGLTFQVASGTFTNNGGTLSGTGNVLLNGADMTLTTSLTNPLSMRMVGSDVAGPGTLINGATGSIEQENGNVNTDVDNSGTYNAHGTCTVSGSFTNQATGVLNVEAEGATPTSLSVGGGMSNAGDVNLTDDGGGADSDLTVTGGTLTNTGTLTSVLAGAGARLLAAALDNQGTVDVDNALTLDQTNATHTNTGDINISGDDFDVSLGGTNPGFDNNGGTINVTGGDFLLTTSGTSPTFDNSGLIDLNGGNAIIFQGGTDPVMTNDGTILLALGDATINNGGTNEVVDNNGSISLTGGDMDILGGGTVSNSGPITIASGHALAHSGGGSFDNESGGSIGGEGEFDVSGTSFINHGGVAPGASPGVLTFTGDFSQETTGTLHCEITGLTPGTQIDRLDVSGTANLGGILDINLSGFSPTLGDTFRVMNHSGYSGVFDNVLGSFIGGGLIFEVDYNPDNVILFVSPEPDTDKVFAFVDPDLCISTVNTCVTIPMVFTRVDNTPARGVSVTFQLSPELQFCAVADTISQGTWLDGYSNIFQVVDNGGGSYTVDQVILGNPCGPTSGGTLFEMRVTNSGGDGTGFISVTEVEVRDCNNAPLPGVSGAPGEVHIDVTPPAAIADLSGTQVKSGNDASGVTAIQVDFTETEVGEQVRVFRKGFEGYPEYDDGGGSVPPVPADTSDALANGWVATDLAMSGDLDVPPGRDYWYYVAVAKDACGNVSSISNLSNGTLGYHLGDVSDGITPGQGDNAVATADISLLGTNYGATLVFNDPVNYLDVGPTADGTVDGRPLTDDEVDFEDLILFAINFGTVSVAGSEEVARSLDGPPVDEDPELVLAGPGTDRPGFLTREIRLQGNESLVKGIHSVVEYDHRSLELVDVSMGDLLAGQSASVFFKHYESEEGLVVDAAAMGRGETVEGSGTVAVLKFKRERVGLQPTLLVGDLRDSDNGKIGEPVVESRDPKTPSSDGAMTMGPIRLLGARPNPFGQSTRISFRLPSESPVSLRVYDIQGRLVRKLIDGSMPAGEHTVVWDGQNEMGHGVSRGIYLYIFRARDYEQTRKLFLVR